MHEVVLSLKSCGLTVPILDIYLHTHTLYVNIYIYVS